MRAHVVVAHLGLALLLAGCGEPTSPQSGSAGPQPGAQSGVRIVNAFSVPVNVFVDGALVASGVQPGQLDTVHQAAGDHTIALSASGTTTPASVHVKTVSDAISTVAAVRLSGALAASELDDTAAIVPAGATKVRVLHLAPNAGEISVYRTQPDWATPISWQVPFNYDSVITGPGCPYYQSTVGTWDIRAWRTPSEDSLGWAGTKAHVTVTLASGEKRTVLVLDQPGGGIQLSVIE